jgi:hypothetical protein
VERDGAVARDSRAKQLSTGYAAVWTTAPDASIDCNGSTLDNVTSDSATVLPK